MIAVDTSAVVAIALKEPESTVFLNAILASPFHMGWPTILECRMVLSAYDRAIGEEFLAEFLQTCRVESIAFDDRLFVWAEGAFRRFGKGRGHPARLNYGDCMSYAVAREFDAPLLFKGGDFAKTDVRVHAASIF